MRTTSATDTARIFISYSTKDGTDAAATLRQDLTREGFSVWQDLARLEGGRDWWSQIEETLKSKALQHVLLIVTPGSLASPVVRREIRLARQEGKTVSPIRGPGIDDLAKLPRWLGEVYDLSRPERRAVLIAVLRLPSNQKRVPMMAPEPPFDFIERPAVIDAIKAQLIDAKGDATPTLAALRGAGGYGKTTVARRIAHDADVTDAYFDGVLWVELGEKPDNLLASIADLVERMTGERPGLQTVNAAASVLGEALGDRRILLVIDDVWREQDLRPFLHGGAHTTRLVTTRIDSVLPADARRQPIDAMQPGEAVSLLGFGLPAEQVAAEGAALSRLAHRLGEWAQAIKLGNGFLRDRVMKAKQPLAQAIAGLNKRLDEKGLDAVSSRSDADRSKSIATTIRISIDLLEASRQQRFGELGIFPEDADIPIGIVGRLWAETGGLDEVDTEDLLSDLYNLSLLLALDLDRRTIRFHDTVRHFLQDQAGKDGLKAQHARLIQAMGDIGGAGTAPAAEAQYFYLHLPHHLSAAGDRATLDALLLDPGWLQAKLAATRSPQALAADYEHYGQGQMQNFIGRTLRLTSGIVARDPAQLLPQLHGRLLTCAEPAAPAFVGRARALIRPPALLTRLPSLTPPGAEVMRLEVSDSWVTALAVLPPRGAHGWQLAAGSEYGTISLWDVATGVGLSSLKLHKFRVVSLAVLPDGRLASGSADSIRLWDPASGMETTCFEGHTDDGTVLAVLPDVNSMGLRLVSGSSEGAIRLWDPATGAETARLDGHTECVTSLAVLPGADGTGWRLASGSQDGTIRLWDLTTGAEIARLHGHTESVTSLAVLPRVDGAGWRLASCSQDETVRLWDPVTSTEIARFNGDTKGATVLAVVPSASGRGWRLASNSDDTAIRLWDPETGTEVGQYNGHTRGISSLAVLPATDGKGLLVASGSGDGTIRFWDTAIADGSIAETAFSLKQVDEFTKLAVLPDLGGKGCRLVSGSQDETIRLWEPATGRMTAQFLCKSGGITRFAVLPTPDGSSSSWQLASGSPDGTIRLWHPETWAETTLMRGHTESITALAVLPDAGGLGSRLVSGSSDKTIRLWDPTTGTEVARFYGHTHSVNDFAMLPVPHGRGWFIVSCSQDKTIRLWDPVIGAETARLDGRSRTVGPLAVLPSQDRTTWCLAFAPFDTGVIGLVDPFTNVVVSRLVGHGHYVVAMVALEPSGGQGWRLASGSWDKTIRLWDVASEREIARLEVDAAVHSLATLPATAGEPRRLVAGDSLGRLHWLEIVE